MRDNILTQILHKSNIPLPTLGPFRDIDDSVYNGRKKVNLVVANFITENEIRSAVLTLKKQELWRIQMLCILTSFRVLRAPESWLKHFFQPFSTFFVHKTVYQQFIEYGAVQR